MNCENRKYFKVTNQLEKHFDFQYKNGLNVLVGPFNDDINQTCCGGRLYITDQDHIHQFYGYGIYLREIILPTQDIDFKMIKDIGKQTTKWGVNKLILGERHYLLDPDTVKKFNLPITRDFIHKLCEIGDVITLQKWKDSGLPLVFINEDIILAQNNGHRHVVEWWEKSGLL